MSVIRLPTAAASPVQQPRTPRPRLMCEASGYLTAVRVALARCPHMRAAILATATVPSTRGAVDVFAVLFVAQGVAA